MAKRILARNEVSPDARLEALKWLYLVADNSEDEAVHDLRDHEAKQAGEKALNDLFEAFDKVDQAMHSGAEDVKAKAVEAHESVKESIQAAVTALKETFTKEEN